MSWLLDWIIREWKRLLALLAMVAALVAGWILHIPKEPAQPPRLDMVSLYEPEFLPDGTIQTWLYVQGANIDEGAVVLLEDAAGSTEVEQPTAAGKRLENSLLGIRPGSFKYPIYHYQSLLVAPGPIAAGSDLYLRVVNEDGKRSDRLKYTLPESADTLDSDGDSLLDVWERDGYDADGDGAIDVNLPALGAHPYRPDIFVEVDVMDCQEPGFGPPSETWDVITETFRSAPIINPDSDPGIRIHIDPDTTVTAPCYDRIDFSEQARAANNNHLDVVDFYDIKHGRHGFTRAFDSDIRGEIYHYCIWGKYRSNSSSGISDVKTAATDITDDFGRDYRIEEIVGAGNDCIVSLEGFLPTEHDVRNRASTFAHELGHNLGQRHNGENSRSLYNPVYNSIMSYSWQLRTADAYDDAWRQKKTIYHPLFYGWIGAKEEGGKLPDSGIGTLIDYSEGMGRDFMEPHEPNESLYEVQSGVPRWDPWRLRWEVPTEEVPAVWWPSNIDYDRWNDDEDQYMDGVYKSILIDFANWPRLDYSGPRTRGGEE